MNIYSKLLRFAKPYWKLLIVAMLLTLSFVFFSNISLWISVDFIRELFSPAAISKTVASDSSRVAATSNKPQSEQSSGIDQLLGMKKKNNLYSRVNAAIKKVIIQSNRYDTLKVVCLVIFLSFLLKNISFYYRRVLLNFIQLKIITGIRNRMQQVLLRLPLSYFDKQHSARLNSIMFNDVSAVNNVFHESFDQFLLVPIQIITNLVILVLISWRLSLITFTIIPVSGFLIVKIGQSIRRKSRRVYEQVSNVVSAFQEAISGIYIVKAFTTEDREYRKFDAANDRFFRAYYRSNKLKFATSPINETLGTLIIVMLLWYGGNLVYANAGLTAEDFVRYLIFLFSTFAPLKELSGLNNSLQTGLAAAERIFRVIDAPQEKYDHPSATEIDTLSDSIQIKDVSFLYNEVDGEVLKHISLDIKKGETVAFVGHSGSGKSTLVKLIPRFYEIQKGEILLDGINTRNLKLHSLRKLMGVVTQDPILFNDTVRNNIAYGINQAGDEQIIAAAKAANAWGFIENMEKGLNTIIGEKGVNLSGGQKQRMSIARAILKNPPILILDEATSSLDTESEKLVQDALEKLMQHRTVLVIAHRLSTIIHADKIVVLNKGEIVDIGPHRRLLKSCGLYRMLYEMQFRDEMNN